MVDVDKVAKLAINQVEALGRMNQAICSFLVFRMIRSEEVVEDHQDASIVHVQIARIAAMVDSMVAWGVEDPINRTQLANQLGMDPKLIERIDLTMEIKHFRRDNEGQRQVERPREVRLNCALSERCREVLSGATPRVSHFPGTK